MSAFATAIRPCACQLVAVDGTRTGCTQTTKSVFAPGHDAKLKGYLIRGSVVQVDGSDPTDPETFATAYLSTRLAEQVVTGRRLLVAKVEAKAAKAAAKAAEVDLDTDPLNEDELADEATEVEAPKPAPRSRKSA